MNWNKLLRASLLATTIAFGQQAADPQGQMKAYMEALRKDLRTEKQSVVDAAMGLEAADKAKFWGVYEKYQGEVTKLWDSRLANIKKYADNFETLSPAVADELVSGTLANHQQFLAILKKYHPLMKTALGAKAAARFVQVEMTLNSLMNVQVGAQLPLMPN